MQAFSAQNARHANRGGGLCTGDILKQQHGDLLVSRHKLRQAAGITLVRKKRDAGNQILGFATRPFVLCGLPIRRPPQSDLVYERRNEFFMLQITGHPDFGLPLGQDRLAPIFLSTLAFRQQSQTIRFKSAAQMLDTFGMAKGGKEGLEPRSSTSVQAHRERHAGQPSRRRRISHDPTDQFQSHVCAACFHHSYMMAAPYSR